MNRKKILYILIFCCILMITGCTHESKAAEKLQGEWHCAATPPNNQNIYTGYMKMKVDKDGSFTIYDAEAGNPGIEGKIKVDSDTDLTLDCEESDDFDPPATWETMRKRQKIVYSFKDNNTLQLTYVKGSYQSVLVFKRQ